MSGDPGHDSPVTRVSQHVSEAFPRSRYKPQRQPKIHAHVSAAWRDYWPLTTVHCQCKYNPHTQYKVTFRLSSEKLRTGVCSDEWIIMWQRQKNRDTFIFIANGHCLCGTTRTYRVRCQKFVVMAVMHFYSLQRQTSRCQRKAINDMR